MPPQAAGGGPPGADDSRSRPQSTPSLPLRPSAHSARLRSRSPIVQSAQQLEGACGQLLAPVSPPRSPGSPGCIPSKLSVGSGFRTPRVRHRGSSGGAGDELSRLRAELEEARRELKAERQAAALTRCRQRWLSSDHRPLRLLFSACTARNHLLLRVAATTAPTVFDPYVWARSAMSFSVHFDVLKMVGAYIEPRSPSLRSSSRRVSSIAHRRTRFAPNVQTSGHKPLDDCSSAPSSPISLASPPASGRSRQTDKRRSSKASSSNLSVRKRRNQPTLRIASQSAQKDRDQAPSSPVGLRRRRTSDGQSPRGGVPARGSRYGSTMSPLNRDRIQWKQGSLLGQGAFGAVHLGLNTLTGELMAVKRIKFDPRDLNIKTKLSQLQTELTLLKTLSHPNVVEYLGTEREGSSVLIFMEYVSGGSVADLLTQFGSLSIDTVCSYTHQILSGLAYLHNRGVIHRDIKAANVLLTVYGECKLSDFGASAMSRTTDTESCMSPSLRVRRQSMQGTPSHMAPEIVTQQEYDEAVDIWSLGCTVMEMLTGSPPFSHLAKGPVETMRYIAGLGAEEDEPVVLPSEEEVPPLVQVFLLRCLVRDPSQRASADALLRDLWLCNSESDWTSSVGDSASEVVDEAEWTVSRTFSPASLRRRDRVAPAVGMLLRNTELGLRRVYWRKWAAYHTERIKRFRDALRQSDKIVGVLCLMTESGMRQLYYSKLSKYVMRRQKAREQEQYRDALMRRACAQQAGVQDLLASNPAAAALQRRDSPLAGSFPSLSASSPCRSPRHCRRPTSPGSRSSRSPRGSPVKARSPMQRVSPHPSSTVSWNAVSVQSLHTPSLQQSPVPAAFARISPVADGATTPPTPELLVEPQRPARDRLRIHVEADPDFPTALLTPTSQGEARAAVQRVPTYRFPAVTHTDVDSSPTVSEASKRRVRIRVPRSQEHSGDGEQPIGDTVESVGDSTTRNGTSPGLQALSPTDDPPRQVLLRPPPAPVRRMSASARSDGRAEVRRHSFAPCSSRRQSLAYHQVQRPLQAHRSFLHMRLAEALADGSGGSAVRLSSFGTADGRRSSTASTLPRAATGVPRRKVSAAEPASPRNSGPLVKLGSGLLSSSGGSDPCDT